jgi:hypothetical protein
MIRLYFAIWRRDVAARTLQHHKVFGTGIAKRAKLETRVQRWNYIIAALTP